MKKNLLAAFLCSNLVCGASAARNPYDAEWGNGRIIFAAQFKNENAYIEGKRVGGSAYDAEKRCYAGKAHYEEIYGSGACERIRPFATLHHDGESLAYHAAFHIVVPVLSVLSVVVAGSVGFLYWKYQDKLKRT